MPENNLTQGEKAAVGCVVSLGIIAVIIILAIIGTGLYLAVHNWG